MSKLGIKHKTLQEKKAIVQRAIKEAEKNGVAQIKDCSDFCKKDGTFALYANQVFGSFKVACESVGVTALSEITEEKKCLRCCKEFTAYAYRNQRFCSKECRIDYRHNKVPPDAWLKCRHCGELYQRKNGYPKYCSEMCRKAAGSRRGNARRRAALNNVKYVDDFSFEQIWERDDGTCQHCRNELDKSLRGYVNPRAPQVDHIIPISRGGADASYNMQILCMDCNVKKGNKIYAVDRKKAEQLWPEKPNIRKGRPVDVRASKLPIGSSGYRGVTFHKGWYRVKIQRNGKFHRCYGFLTAEEAALCYNDLARKLGVDEKYLNRVE